jgi:hypothetical protein
MAGAGRSSGPSVVLWAVVWTRPPVGGQPNLHTTAMPPNARRVHRAKWGSLPTRLLQRLLAMLAKPSKIKLGANASDADQS